MVLVQYYQGPRCLIVPRSYQYAFWKMARLQLYGRKTLKLEVDIENRL